jgi:putative chitobiose transport system substrate-binding protein
MRLATFLLALICWFCTAGGAAPPADKVLTFWTMQLSPHHDAYIEGLIAAFEREHPGIRIRWSDVPWSEMEKRTLTALAGKQGPDIVNLNPQFAARLAEFGALADPERYFTPAEIGEYLPAAWNGNRLAGKTFAVPWYLTTNVLLYNKALLAKSGVQAPRTFDELIGVSRAVRAATGNYAYFPSLDGSIPLETLAAMGAPLLDAKGCAPGFGGAAGQRVLDYFGQMYREGLAPRNVVTEGHRKAVEMFASREVAMITSGMQFLQGIRSANPALYRDIGVAPQMSAAEVPPNIAAMNIAVLNGSKEQAAAFRFVRHVTTAENQTAFAKRVPILPSSRGSYGDAFFSQTTGDALLDEARAISIAQVTSGAVLVPPMRHYNKLRASYSRGLQAVMLGRKTPVDALAQIDREWRALLRCPT